MDLSFAALQDLLRTIHEEAFSERSQLLDMEWDDFSENEYERHQYQNALMVGVVRVLQAQGFPVKGYALNVLFDSDDTQAGEPEDREVLTDMEQVYVVEYQGRFVAMSGSEGRDAIALNFMRNVYQDHAGTRFQGLGMDDPLGAQDYLVDGIKMDKLQESVLFALANRHAQHLEEGTPHTQTRLPRSRI